MHSLSICPRSACRFRLSLGGCTTPGLQKSKWASQRCCGPMWCLVSLSFPSLTRRIYNNWFETAQRGKPKLLGTNVAPLDVAMGFHVGCTFCCHQSCSWALLLNRATSFPLQFRIRRVRPASSDALWRWYDTSACALII